MRHIFFILFLMSITLAQAQVKLTQVEPDTVKWSLPVAHKSIPGQTGKHFLKYMQLGKLMDTLGLGQPDSIYLSGDNIKLRDGAGVAQLPTASTSTKGLLSSTDWNTFNGKVGGSGTATRVAFWNGTNSLSSNSNLYWDNVNGRLGIGNVSPTTALHVNGGITQNFPLNSGLINTNIGTNMNSTMTGTYNIAIGQNNLNANTTGSANFAAGQSCLINNTTGIYNFASGLNSLFSNIGGQYNFSVGRDNLYSNTSGNSNFATGQNNLYLNTTGVFNFANGFANLYSNLGGSYNFASGQQNLHLNTSGSYNFGTGLGNLYSNTTGTTNFTSGQNNMYFNQNGSYNFGVGQNSLYSNTGGNYNFASGLNNLYRNTNGSYNFAVGLNNLFENTTGNYNVALSRDALRLNQSGSDNIAIGNQAGYNSLGSRNIYLGFAAGGGETGSNTLYITHTLANTSGIFGDFANGRFGFNQPPSALTRTLDINGEVRIRDLTTDTPTRIVGADADGDLGEIVLGTGLSFTGNTLNATGGSGSSEYLDPYIISSDTVGFILKNVMDTVQFIGVAGVTGESTTVSDSPTINMTLTGTNITGEIVDGSVTPAKLSQAYLTSEVDGSTTNEIQTLSISGSDLTISGAGGNTVTLPSGGGSSEWASLHYGSLAANTQTLTSSVWNTINFTGSSESNASIIDANHTNDEIEFVSAGTYRVDYRVSFIANADGLIYSGIYSSASSSVDGNTQMESDTDSGYKHTIMQHSYIKTAVAGEKIKLQVQPLIAHTSVAIYSNFIVTKL